MTEAERAEVVQLFPDLEGPIGEEVDTSFINTAKRTVILGYKAGSLLLNRFTGCELPHVRNKEQVQPKRHAELNPDRTFVVESRTGSEHEVDIYGEEFLDPEASNLAPIVYTMSLALPHDKGFQAPIIDQIQQSGREQGRATIVVSAEGFSNKGMGVKDSLNLTFEQMAHNVHDSLDKVEEKLGHEIPSIITAGGSRGGTLSLLLATDEIRQDRRLDHLTDRQVESALAFAPAGLKPLDSIKKKLKVTKQFMVNEPFHVVRKASKQNPEELREYYKSLKETGEKIGKRMLPIAKTGILFVQDTPLEDIGQRIPTDTKVRVLTMKNDGITTPHYWRDEFKNHDDFKSVLRHGHHLSIDSLQVADFVIEYMVQDAINKWPDSTRVPVQAP